MKARSSRRAKPLKRTGRVGQTGVPGQNPKANDTAEHDLYHEENRRNLYDPDLGRALKRPQHTRPQTQKPPPQRQSQPGSEHRMLPQPIDEDERYRGNGKLADKVAVITGGDSGIGRAVAIAFAKEGADVAIVYLSEEKDAERTRKRVEELGRRCLKIAGNVGDEKFVVAAIQKILDRFGRLDIVVNNAAEQNLVEGIEDITDEQFEHTWRTNLLGYVHMIKAALPHLKPGSAIINTTSVQAYQLNPN